MRLVNIGKHSWAVGLNWVKYKDKRKRYADLQKEVTAISDGVPDMVTFRPRQYGFGVAGEQQAAYRASNPLAGGIEIVGSSFLGVFYLKDTDNSGFWWLFAIKNGLISANGELICATREEVEAEVVQLRDLLGTFEENVLCEMWDEEETPDNSGKPSSLELLVLGEARPESEKISSLEWLEPLLTYRRSSRLHLLKNIYQRRRRHLIGGVAATICLTGGLTLTSLLASWNEERAMREIQLASQTRLQQKADVLAHPEREFLKPWVTAMPVPAMVQRCLGTMLALPMVASGWALESAVCDGHKVDVSWKFEPGSDYLALPPDASLISPQKAVSSIRLPEFSPQKQEQDTGHSLLSPRSLASRHFYQLTQSMGALLALKFRPQEKKTVSKADKQEIVAPWQRGEWELKGIPAALMFDSSLALSLSMPGMILRNIEYSGEWSFKGEIYVLPR